MYCFDNPLTILRIDQQLVAFVNKFFWESHGIDHGARSGRFLLPQLSLEQQKWAASRRRFHELHSRPACEHAALRGGRPFAIHHDHQSCVVTRHMHARPATSMQGGRRLQKMHRLSFQRMTVRNFSTLRLHGHVKTSCTCALQHSTSVCRQAAKLHDCTATELQNPAWGKHLCGATGIDGCGHAALLRLFECLTEFEL